MGVAKRKMSPGVQKRPMSKRMGQGRAIVLFAAMERSSDFQSHMA